MKKILKISLFIIVFCLLLILFSNSKVQAADVVTVTTIQELQEVMGAIECSVIEGTTLKITKNFTWDVQNDIDMRVTEVIIDFNGNEIRIENDKETNLGINLLEGKVIFKDSKSVKGGIYATGNIFILGNGTELIIENGKYTAAHVQETNNGFVTNIDNGLIKNLGGNITVENGNFKTMEYSELFQFIGGKMTINNGTFDGKGNFIHALGNISNITKDSELIINGGSFNNEASTALLIDAYGNSFKVIVNGGTFIATRGSCIGVREFKYRSDWTERNGVNY